MTDSDSQWRLALRGALEVCSDVVEIRAHQPRASRAAWRPDAGALDAHDLHEIRFDHGKSADLLGHLPFGPVLQLAAYRPDLVIAEDFGALALHAALYRSLSRRSRLLLCAAEPPRRCSPSERMILRRADGVLADGDEVAHAIAQFRFPTSRIFQLSSHQGLDAFLARGGRARAVPEAHRLVYAGDLSPQSGTADLLISLASWAEQNPGRQAEIWWIGKGDLAGVLSAQPLPETVLQHFLGDLDPLGMASAFGQCGLLVAPSLTDDRRSPIAEALSAGLPVLGSRRNRKVRQFVREETTGWLFDPLQTTDMVQALGRALGSSAQQLDRMRDQARAAVRPVPFRSFAERLRSAVAAIMPDLALDGEPLTATT